MTRAWRIVKKKRSAEAFTGEGARVGGGRWNLPGAPLIYCADSLALAALELFIRIREHGRYVEFVRFQVDIPDSVVIETIEEDKLPPEWSVVPAPPSTKSLGSQWAGQKRTAVLKVPSVTVAEGFNIILNPLHPDFGKIVIHNPPLPFTFDPRMWGQPTPYFSVPVPLSLHPS